MNWTEANVHLLPRMTQEIEKDLCSSILLARLYLYKYTVSFPFQGWSGTGDQFYPLYFNPLRAGK
jgi:hypothetical protein